MLKSQIAICIDLLEYVSVLSRRDNLRSQSSSCCLEIKIQLQFESSKINGRTMEIKSKVKSFTQVPIRGTRLYPTQIITEDSSKSIHASEDTNNKCFQKLVYSNHAYTHNEPTEGLKFSARHSIHPGSNYRSFTSRSNLEYVTKSRFTFHEGSNFQNISSNQSEADTQSRIQKRMEIRNDSTISNKQSRQNNQPNPFQELAILRITSVEEKEIVYANEFQKIKINTQFQPAACTSIKRQQQLPFHTLSGEQKINKNLYEEYKQKYELLAKDNNKILDKFRKLEILVESLQHQREQERLILSAQRHQIQQQKQKILKLQETISINQSINEQLMEKDRENEKRLKIEEEEDRQAETKKRLEEAKQQMIAQSNQKHEQTIQIYEKKIFGLKLKFIQQSKLFEKRLKEIEEIHNTRHKQLQLEIQTLKSEKSTFFIQLQTIISERQQTMLSNDAFQIDNRRLKKQLLTMSSEIDRRQQNDMQFVQEIAKLQEEKMLLDQQVLELSRANQKLELLNLQLDQQHIRLDNENLKLAEENHNLTLELKSVAQNKTVVLDHNIDDVAKISALQQANKSLTGNIKNIQSRFNTLMSVNYGLQHDKELLLQTVNQFPQKCSRYEARIEWLDLQYKSLEHNLLETQEELVRIHCQYINQKLNRRNSNDQDACVNEIKQNHIVLVQSMIAGNEAAQKEQKISQFDMNIITVSSETSENEHLQEADTIPVLSKELQKDASIQKSKATFKKNEPNSNKIHKSPSSSPSCKKQHLYSTV